jgi:exopolysaccharide biosynthesis predicted pyruvyltransferase EpsI
MTPGNPVLAQAFATSTRQLTERLAQRLLAELSAVGLEGADVALLDYPLYANAGDHAIWLGTLAALDALNARIVTIVGQPDYDGAALARSLTPATKLLICGGGNFGDLWGNRQTFRRAVLHDFPAHHVVQLPQTLHYISSQQAVQDVDAFRRHASFTILARDEGSAELAERFSDDVRLTPDMAFAMGPLHRERSVPSSELLVLARQDKEASGIAWSLPATAVRRDWPDLGELMQTMPARARNARRALRVLRGPVGRVPGTARVAAALRPRLARQISTGHLDAGFRVLDLGHAVATDRLHAHILCVLRGQPHAVVDNSYGKVSAFMRCWTKSVVPLSTSPDAAILRLGPFIDEAKRINDGR